MKTFTATLFILTLALAASAAEIRFDFESGDLQGWKVVEGEFGKLISDRAKEHHGDRAYTKQGTWFLSTLESADGKRPDDRFTGVVESPVVILSAPEIRLRVGGGNGENVYAALCTLDGKEIAYARGGNSQTLHQRKWNVPELVGKPVFFRVADRVETGWCHITLDELVCQGVVDPVASEKNFKARKLAAVKAGAVSKITSLKAAVQELEKKFRDKYPGEKFMKAIAAVEDGADAAAIESIRFDALVRSNPLLTANSILFVTRKQYRSDHHNTATLFQTGEINAGSYDSEGSFKLLDVKSGTVKNLYNPGPKVTVRDPEIDFDAKRIVFSMRKSVEDNYHIYTINSDGSGLKQLTSAGAVTDIDPLWLPDGDIVFSSSREPKYCMCNRHIMCNLYRMKPDGANIHQIGKSTLFEGHSSLMPDGRILYDRWEYVDRNFGDAQGLWVCNQDGTGHAIYYGNNTTSPGGVIDARAMEGGNKAIAIMGSCHDRPWGALGIIDRSIGVDGIEPVLRTWPASFKEKITVKGQSFDSTKRIKRKYEDPWPLDDEHFLCSRQVGKGEEMGIYYLDLHGNEVLVYKAAPGCYDPMPLAAREAPPVQPSRRDFSDPKGMGAFYVQNVYIGTHMKGVEKGSIKYLRIIESPEKRSWTTASWNGQGAQAPAMNWHSFENKRILGTVPVESDGSAFFEVPANTYLYFQVLDEYKVMVQSMRSGIYVQPGENYGCVGCHESRVGDIPQTGSRPAALKRPASKLEGWFGPPRRFSFQQEVQPIFDKHCIKCHDYGKKGAKALNLSGDRDVVFSTSYVDIWVSGVISCVGGGLAEIQDAGSWGSCRSKLLHKVFKGHGGVQLSGEELERLITWVDLNAPYYPFYEFSEYGGNPGGRSPLTKAEVEKITKLTGKKISFKHQDKQRSTISFERPELSRILEGIKKDSVEYKEVIALINKGAERMKINPRADMPGFKPGGSNQFIHDRYESRLAVEREVYKAIREGRKVYD
ncbi:MAG: hypothetical protein PF904_21215 [Kiritimatiellae bacterium]|nr:hypothetical protein [Kiritimatiellia bacterium]